MVSVICSCVLVCISVYTNIYIYTYIALLYTIHILYKHCIYIYTIYYLLYPLYIHCIGFGIQEFPALWPLLIEKSILIESCPISNQLLGLVVDMRNHPIGQMLKHNIHNNLETIDNIENVENVEYNGENSKKSEKIMKNSKNSKNSKYAELMAISSEVSEILSNMRNTSRIPVSISNDDPGFWGIDASVSYDWYVSVLAWDLSIGGIKQLTIDSIVYSTASIDVRVDMIIQWNKDWNEWVANNI